jgi:pilus assembly protein CpaE
MNEPSKSVARILVIHPEEEQRRTLEKQLRSVAGAPATIYQAVSLPAGAEAARRLDPRVLLLDLNGERALALEIAREARRPDRLLIGLYNPLLLPDGEAATLFRQASRAGISDFVPLPAGEAELAAALAGTPDHLAAESEGSEGRLVVFLSPKGGIGTTTLAASSALALVSSERILGGVALCDAALPFGTAAAMIGLAPDRDLADLVRDLDNLKALGSYLTSEERSHLALLAAPRDPYRAQAITPEDLSRVLILLRRRFSRVIVDTPTGFDLLSLAAVDLAERIYVVTEASAPTVLVTARFIRMLEEQELGGDRLRVVLNRFSTEDDLSVDLVAEQLGRSPDFVVPFDGDVPSAANSGDAVVLSSAGGSFANAVGQLADDIATAGVAARS